MPGNGASITSSMQIPAYETAELTDIRIDWAAVDMDMYCNGLVPEEDLEWVTVVWLKSKTQQEVSQMFATQGVHQADMSGVGVCDATRSTSCMIGGAGINLDNYKSNNGTFLVLLDDATTTRSLAFLSPTPDSVSTEVFLEPLCPMNFIEADLSESTLLAPAQASPSSCEAGTGWPVDWSGLTATVLGEALDPDNVDLLVLSHYLVGLEELEASFVSRDALAEEIYTLEVFG